MKTVVVMPTYNEAENIGAMLDALLAQKNLYVLIVDDNSPDGTADIVRKNKSKRLELLSGTKQGLGVAYKRGFAYALEKMHADVVIEMDADFSHDPADLSRLVDEIKTGADFVIGSRYVKGGKIVGWGLHRYFISWGGNFFARIVAGMYRVRDCTAGFRALKRQVIERVNWNRFASKGYSFQISLLHNAIQQGAKVVEIPVTFKDRELGQSKIGFSDMKEFVLVSIELGWKTYGRLAKFLLVGLTGIIVNLGVFSLLFRVFGLAQWIGVAAGMELSIISNFLLHELWTFSDRKKGTALARATKYHYTSLLGAAITFAIALGLFAWTSLVEEFALLLAIGAGTISNFALSYLWAWKQE